MDGKVSHQDQLFYLRRYTLTEGSASGTRMIEVHNGTLRFLLCESKGLDITQLWHKGVNISFLSKNGIVNDSLPFPHRFEGGMLYTCGLDSIGQREGYELHGRYHSTPARVISLQCDQDIISVTAEIQDTSLFGQHLVLVRTISTRPFSPTVTITDTLTNIGHQEASYCLLYHVNLGYPMLDECAKVHTSSQSVTPRNAWAAESLSWRTTPIAPLPGREEACYFLAGNTGKVSVENPKINRLFTMEYSTDTLPHFVQWNSMQSGCYALGLEPCTCPLDDGFFYNQLSPEEAKAFSLSLTIQDTPQ